MEFAVVCCGWLGSGADEASGVRSVEFCMVMDFLVVASSSLRLAIVDLSIFW